MTSRERNLTILLITALVVVGVLVGVKQFKESAQKVQLDISKTEAELKESEYNVKLAEARMNFADFLNDYEPKKERYGSEIQDELQQVCKMLWERNRLMPIKSFRFATPDPGKYYHRRRISLELRGEERSLISFLTQISDPKKFRSVTKLLIRPTQGDETNTKVDATIEVDQWFIPDTDVTDDVIPVEEAKPPVAPASPIPTSPKSKDQELPPGLDVSLYLQSFR